MADYFAPVNAFNAGLNNGVRLSQIARQNAERREEKELMRQLGGAVYGSPGQTGPDFAAGEQMAGQAGRFDLASQFKAMSAEQRQATSAGFERMAGMLAPFANLDDQQLSAATPQLMDLAQQMGLDAQAVQRIASGGPNAVRAAIGSVMEADKAFRAFGVSATDQEKIRLGEMNAQNTAIANAIKSRSVDLQAARQQQGPSGQDASRRLRNVSPGQSVIDESTGEVVYSAPAPPPGVNVNAESSMRKEVTQQLKEFNTVKRAFGKLEAASKADTPAGDMSLVFAFMKMLDPNSTVREGEYATAENARGVDSAVASLYNRVLDGTRLTPAQRLDFVARAQEALAVEEQNAQDIVNRYRTIAQNYGYDPTNVIPDFGENLDGGDSQAQRGLAPGRYTWTPDRGLAGAGD